MPTLEKQCPTGTTSLAGTSSELQCTCILGYLCSYTKVINAVVRLQMTLDQFNQPGVQAAFKIALAAASNANVDNIEIMGVTVDAPPTVGAPPTGPPAGAGRRRLFWVSGGAGGSAVEKRGVGAEAHGGAAVPGIRVFLEVRGGGSDLNGLDGHLINSGLEPSLDHAWYSPHSVSVKVAS
jgi:hypothetical protein